ncbi:MAG: signal peptide peptidase SppA [Hyphomonadaceae bacterium]|nr:signal peptide peptidase SppA [Hyphomonadaceae bacterium]
MRQFFITLLAVIVGVFVALFLMFMFFAVLIGSAVNSLNPPNGNGEGSGATVLTMDLRSGMRDHGGDKSLFGDSSASVVTSVRALDRAKEDDNVKGLFIRANSWGMSPAQAEELHMAIDDFQESGKFVIAHAQGFEGTSLSSYFAVSGADEIWLQDTTGFALSGYRAEIEFLGGVFEKLDAEPEIIQFHEYKNAANTYKEKSLTEPHREAMTTLLQSILDTAVSTIAEDRGITEQALLQFLDNAPHSAEKAEELGFIHKLGHVVDAKDYAKNKAGKNAKFKSVSDYGVGYTDGPVIAFVGGQGAVVEGNSSDGSNPFVGGNLTMGGDTVSEALIKASKDDKVKAIVFRVNSPGGSATASDQIWDAVDRAKEAGKPVVISMGQYAASGGYYVAANADKIVALPTTVTGSIGVLGGKFYIKDTLAKIGYNAEAINLGGEYGAAYSAIEPWNQANREAYRQSMENIYVDFTTRVSEGRDIPIDRVKEIAKGRVWTGEQAKEIGLIDEFGGFSKAVEVAKQLADIDSETKVRIKMFPREKTPHEQLVEMFNVTAQSAASLQKLGELAQTPEFQAMIKARDAMEQAEKAHLKAVLPEIK